MIYTSSKSDLLKNFNTFYYEILRYKEKALRIYTPIAMDGKEEEKNPKLINFVHTTQDHFLNLIERSTKEASPKNKDIDYMMASFIDEIFLTLPWEGIKEWEESLLEKRLFQTQIAGELIFKKIDAILEEAHPSQKEIATLYFLILCLGFKGRYQNQGDEEQINFYKKQLYSFVNPNFSRVYHTNNKRMIPQCYEYDISTLPGKGLPDVQTWLVYMGGIIGFYLLITYVIWQKISSDLHDALNLILQQSIQGSLT